MTIPFQVIQLLIRRGANVNCGTVSGLTPLLLAGSCLTPRFEVIQAQRFKIIFRFDTEKIPIIG